MASRECVIRCIEMLAEMPGRELTETAARMYRLAVFGKSLSDEECRVLMTAAITRCRMRPSPAELLAILGELRGVAPVADQIMPEIMAAIDDGGEYVRSTISWVDSCGKHCEHVSVWRPGMPSWLSKRGQNVVAMLGGWDAVKALHSDGRLGAAVASVCRDLEQRGIHDLADYKPLDPERRAGSGRLESAAGALKKALEGAESASDMAEREKTHESR